MTEALSHVLEAVASVAADKAQGLSGETRIDSLQLDSLDEVEVLMALEDKLSVEIDQAQVNACRTLGDLAALVEAQLSRAS